MLFDSNTNSRQYGCLYHLKRWTLINIECLSWSIARWKTIKQLYTSTDISRHLLSSLSLIGLILGTTKILEQITHRGFSWWYMSLLLNAKLGILLLLLTLNFDSSRFYALFMFLYLETKQLYSKVNIGTFTWIQSNCCKGVIKIVEENWVADTKRLRNADIQNALTQHWIAS